MRQYEVTFIVDPVLSGDEIKATAKTYEDFLVKEGCEIVNVDAMGLRQLLYPINRRTSGIYYCIEFKSETGKMIGDMELAFRRDSRTIRFLTVRLDKYGVQYNLDKRDGKIGKAKKTVEREEAKKSRAEKESKSASPKKASPVKAQPIAKTEPAKTAPVVKAEPVKVAPAPKVEVSSKEEE